MPANRVAPIWMYRYALALIVLGTTACDGKSAGDSSVTKTDNGRIEHGRVLLERYQCGACHTITGVAQARGTAGPSLDQFGRRSYVAGQIPNTEELLAKWILDPHGLISTTSMPNMGVTPVDARDMARYLRSLR